MANGPEPNTFRAKLELDARTLGGRKRRIGALGHVRLSCELPIEDAIRKALARYVGPGTYAGYCYYENALGIAKTTRFWNVEVAEQLKPGPVYGPRRDDLDPAPEKVTEMIAERQKREAEAQAEERQDKRLEAIEDAECRLDDQVEEQWTPEPLEARPPLFPGHPGLLERYGIIWR